MGHNGDMTKKTKQNPERERILGRKLAREIPREELEKIGGGADLWTLSYPESGEA
jgi:hypothetical protein